MIKSKIINVFLIFFSILINTYYCLDLNSACLYPVCGDPYETQTGQVILQTGTSEKFCCWQIQPQLDQAGAWPKYINFTIEDLLLDTSPGTARTLVVYSSWEIDDSDSKAVTISAANINGTKRNFVIQSSKAMIVRYGTTGVSKFTINYVASTETIANPSLQLFWSLAFIFMVPLCFVALTICPCVVAITEKKYKWKKKNVRAVVFVVGSAIGFLIMLLVLGNVITIES